MNIELTTAPVGLHPLKTNDAASTFVTGQIFETLYRRTVDAHHMNLCWQNLYLNFLLTA
jgi:hypothetical protein